MSAQIACLRNVLLRIKCSVQSSHVLISIRSVLTLNANGSQGAKPNELHTFLSLSVVHTLSLRVPLGLPLTLLSLDQLQSRWITLQYSPPLGAPT